jgi:hypothetical protein
MHLIIVSKLYLALENRRNSYRRRENLFKMYLFRFGHKKMNFFVLKDQILTFIKINILSPKEN